MVTLLFTSIAAVIILVVVVYLWQKPATQSKLQDVESPLPLPPFPEHNGLFDIENKTGKELTAGEGHSSHELLLTRAESGDHSALEDAHKNFARKVYDEILSRLVKQADSDAKLLSLLSHVTRNELPVTRELAEAAIHSWAGSPDRGSTSRTLHITALASDARLYQTTVDTALKLWRTGLILNVSAAELRALFDGEYWVLSQEARNSGAGFMLKLFLAKVRRELEATTSVN
jgi:hypothetical protein